MDRPTLTIHIGAPKTGTTLLQRQATAHRALLKSEGVLYPSGFLRGYGHHDLAFLLDGGFPTWATPANVTLEELAHSLREECTGYARDILLSSENFFLFPQPAALARFLEDAGLVPDRRVVILLYVRRQDDLLESWYNQAVKAQGFTGAIAEMQAAPPAFLDFAAGIAAWTEVFGHDAMQIRTYEDAAASGLERDFWNAVRPGLADLVPPAETVVNTQIARDILEVQRILNGLDLTIIEKRGLHREFMAMSNDSAARVSLLSNADRAVIMETYHAGNALLSRDWFAGRPLFPAPLGGPDQAPEYDGLSTARAVEILAKAFLQRRSSS